MEVPLAAVWVPSHLPWVSSQLHWLLLIRVIIKWFWGSCIDLLAFALQLRKPHKTSARRLSDEGTVWPVIASIGVPFLQMRSIGSRSISVSEKERNKEGMGILPGSQLLSSIFNILSWFFLKVIKVTFWGLLCRYLTQKSGRSVVPTAVANLIVLCLLPLS